MRKEHARISHSVLLTNKLPNKPEGEAIAVFAFASWHLALLEKSKKHFVWNGGVRLGLGAKDFSSRTEAPLFVA